MILKNVPVRLEGNAQNIKHTFHRMVASGSYFGVIAHLLYPNAEMLLCLFRFQ